MSRVSEFQDIWLIGLYHDLEASLKYLFLAYSDERHEKTLSASDHGTLEAACIASNEVLRESGYLLAAENLQSSGAVTTVRVLKGQVRLTDGPLARTNEHLTGLYFINARDLNEAILVASKMPQTRRGPIEVCLIE